MGQMEKYDIVNGLARTFQFRRYFEICTTTTGKKYQFVEAQQFETCHRLMYRCPDQYQDGQDITFRTTADSSYDLVRHLHSVLPAGARYDVIFVDPHHTYQSSIVDLHGAMCLLEPHDVLVVHDCNPTDATIVQLDYQDGDWCGVTYQAFVDFILSVRCAGYCTVDTDYGCGVVFNAAAAVPEAWRRARPSDSLVFEWHAVRDDNRQRFAFFEKHRDALLNLVSPDRFQAVYPLTRRQACSAGESSTASAAPAGGRFTDDADLHLLADGVRIVPFAAEAGHWQFRFPAGTRALRLVSRAASPAAIGNSNDHRVLGFCIQGIAVQAGGSTETVRPDSTGFTDGVYAPEGAAPHSWRRTNGNATLPVRLSGARALDDGPLDDRSGEIVLILNGHCMPRYLTAGGTRAQAKA